MSQQIIPLTGIIRNLPDNTVIDGAMHELINLRPKDGKLKPAGSKSLMTYLSSSPDARFIHTINNTIKVVIGTDSSGAFMYSVYQNEVFLQSVHEPSITPNSDMSFASLKNSLMLTNNSTEEITLLIFNEDTNYYAIFHDYFLPSDLPSIFVQRFAVPGDNVTPPDFPVGLETDYGQAALSQYVKMQKEKGDTGYLSGKVLVRFAWELFDGSMVKHTIPVQTSTSEITTTATYSATAISSTTPGWKITTSFIAYSLQFQISCDSSWFNTFYNKYKNIFRSLRIYVSLPKSPEAPSIGDIKEVTHHGVVINGKFYFGSKIKEYDVGKLKNYEPDPASELYFLLKEYTLEDLKQESTGIGTWRTMCDKPSTTTLKTVQDLTTRDQLPVDSFSHHQLFSKRLFTYNERIFLGDIKNNLYSGFPINDLVFNSNGTTGDDYDVGIEYDITTSRGTKTVFSGWKTLNTYDQPTLGYARFQVGYTNDHFIGYPDARARVMRILIRRTAVPGTIYLYYEFTLTAVPSQNFSYIRGFLVQFPQAFTNRPITSLSTNPTYYWDYNRVQATELNNPFCFPAINSYRIGLGSIVGMSSNAIALSTGQFGQYPIYVFTSDGIWTMNIGTGENLINSISPLSRDVCSVPASITPIDGGTAFMSAHGCMIISGNQVIEISKSAEGNHRSRITLLNAYADLINDPAYYQFYTYLCTVDMLTYLSGAVIGYDHIKKELIVSNHSYNYSWIYSLEYKSWFKINESFWRFVNDFPDTYGVRATGSPATYTLYSVSTENPSIEPVVHAETRPLKLTNIRYKKLLRMILQGNYRNVIAPSLKFTVAVFGTNNLKNWFLLNNTGRFENDDQLIIGRSQFSCQYFIVIFGGYADLDSHFTNLIVEFEERYFDKLR